MCLATPFWRDKYRRVGGRGGDGLGGGWDLHGPGVQSIALLRPQPRARARAGDSWTRAFANSLRTSAGAAPQPNDRWSWRARLRRSVAAPPGHHARAAGEQGTILHPRCSLGRHPVLPGRLPSLCGHVRQLLVPDHAALRRNSGRPSMRRATAGSAGPEVLAAVLFGAGSSLDPGPTAHAGQPTPRASRAAPRRWVT